MVTERTNTSQFKLTPENHYEAIINQVLRKEIKGGLIIYEWHFDTFINDNPLSFKIAMFASQMNELLRAIGATEVAKNEFEWDRDAIKGMTLSFNLCHVEDKKGILRETLSDIKMVSPAKEVTW